MTNLRPNPNGVCMSMCLERFAFWELRERPCERIVLQNVFFSFRVLVHVSIECFTISVMVNRLTSILSPLPSTSAPLGVSTLLFFPPSSYSDISDISDRSRVAQMATRCLVTAMSLDRVLPIFDAHVWHCVPSVLAAADLNQGYQFSDINPFPWFKWKTVENWSILAYPAIQAAMQSHFNFAKRGSEFCADSNYPCRSSPCFMELFTYVVYIVMFK